MERKTPGIKNPKDKETGSFAAPEGFWARCPSCQAILQQSHIDENAKVCSECSHHFRMGSRERISLICDEGSFIERDMGLKPHDVLEFFDSKPYSQRITIAQKKTGMNEGFVAGDAKINGRPVQVGAFEFSFMGGSMGMVVGEKISRVFDRAYETRSPAIIFQASGGARMQEGLLSLMQMAKTTVARARLAERGIPYISVLTDPTTGGVAASFAMLGDVTVAEPKALVGFAGPRVIAQTISQKLPENFQRAEFLLQHGMIDAIIHRKDLRAYLSRVLGFLTGP